MTTARDRTVADLLSAHALFGALDESERATLARLAVRKPLAKRQRLYARGDAGDALVLVVTGRLEIARAGVTFRALGAGALVGLSTLAGVAHSADVIAAVPSTVLVLPGAGVRALFSRRPELPLKLVAGLAELVSALSDDVAALRDADVEERTRRKVLQLARGRREVEITHAELARLVGATRANTSRALAALEHKGVLVRRRGRIEVR